MMWLNRCPNQFSTCHYDEGIKSEFQLPETYIFLALLSVLLGTGDVCRCPQRSSSLCIVLSLMSSHILETVQGLSSSFGAKQHLPRFIHLYALRVSNRRCPSWRTTSTGWCHDVPMLRAAGSFRISHEEELKQRSLLKSGPARQRLKSADVPA